MNHQMSQHKYLYKLLHETNLMPDRHALVLAFSNNRTDNSSELHTHEIEQMIGYLKEQKQLHISQENRKLDKMRKRILSLCYQYGYTKYCRKNKRLVVDYEKLNSWLLKYGYLHKPLNHYTIKELPKLITQFEKVVKGYIATVRVTN